MLDRSPYNIDVLLSGMAAGVDTFAEDWAAERQIPVEHFPPDWKLHTRNAVLIRNCEMARAADACLAIWDGHSRGTWSMIEVAAHYKLQVTIRTVCD